jgi:hypothetical protein
VEQYDTSAIKYTPYLDLNSLEDADLTTINDGHGYQIQKYQYSSLITCFESLYDASFCNLPGGEISVIE